jgi:hypothetical protein
MSKPVPQPVARAKPQRRAPQAIDYSDEVTKDQRARLKQVEDSLNLGDGTWETGEAGW